MSGTKEQEQKVKQIIRDVVTGPNSHVVFEQMSKDPWIYDPIVEEDEVMYYKLKDKCPRCGMSAKHHRDDCTWSIPFIVLYSTHYQVKHITIKIN